MDLNVLSKLFSRTDMIKATEERVSTHEGFDTFFTDPDSAQLSETVAAMTCIGKPEIELVETQLRSDQAPPLNELDSEEGRLLPALPAPKIIAKNADSDSNSVVFEPKQVSSRENNRNAAALQTTGQDRTSFTAASTHSERPSRVHFDESARGMINRTLTGDAVRTVETAAAPHGVDGLDGKELPRKHVPPINPPRAIELAQQKSGSPPEQGSVISTSSSGTEPMGRSIKSNVVGVVASAAGPPIPSDPTANVLASQVQVTSVAGVPDRGLGVSLEVPRAAERTASDAPRAGMSPNTLPMTLLERHLGGHAVRLMPGHIQKQLGNNGFKPSTWGEKSHLNLPAANMTPTRLVETTELFMQPMSGLAVPTQQVIKGIFTMHPVVTELNASMLQNDISLDGPVEIRANATPTGTAPIATVSRADLAPTVAHQIADAMRNGADKPIEIALSPAELGRVRMILSPSDTGVTMSILADRPETLDLMRRNIDDLNKSFAELGYEDISFSFGHSDQQTDDTSQNQNSHNEQTAGEVTMPAVSKMTNESTSHLAIAPDGIDMRL